MEVLLGTSNEWERIQDAEKIIQKAKVVVDEFIDKYPDAHNIGLTDRCMELSI